MKLVKSLIAKHVRHVVGSVWPSFCRAIHHGAAAAYGISSATSLQGLTSTLFEPI